LHANAKRGKKQASPNGNLMAAIITFVFFIIGGLLSLLWLAIIISAVLSWLFAFEVINPRNRAVAQISYALDRVTDPILRPFRRIIPSAGRYRHQPDRGPADHHGPEGDHPALAEVHAARPPWLRSPFD
jgi:YggT family protein